MSLIAVSDTLKTITPDSLKTAEYILPGWPFINNTVPWVTLIIGILIIIIAHFAGGRLNSKKILFTITFTLIVGILVMPLFERLAVSIASLFGSVRVGWIISMSLFMAFLAAVAVNLYEIIVVTAREAYPVSERL